MHLNDLSPTARNGLARELRNRQYERSEKGVLFTKSKLFVGGAFKHAINDDPAVIDPNDVVRQGIDYILSSSLGTTAQNPQYFLAPFSGNVAVQPTWTGANFDAQATEFTGYVATTRPEWVRPAAAASQAIGNSASPVIFTFAAGGPYNLYGMALLTASAKEATTGLLIAATRFASPRLNQQAGDRLSVEYIISAQDDGA
ncbi:MAG: hypothetical protein ACRC2H_07490 [Silanimonas sp.]